MAKFTTSEIGPHAFQAGLFITGADDLSPIVILPARTLQRPWEVGEELKRAAQVWASYAAVGGIAQYSLLRRQPVGILGRFNSYFREAEPEEVTQDVDELGDQVFGPPLKEASEREKRRPTFKFLSETFTYSGPERVERVVFTTRSFPGPLPSDIADLVGEVDQASEQGDTIISQGYHLYVAEDGRLRYCAFAKAENFNPDQFRPHGRVEIKRRKMLYYPKETANPIDFTTLLHSN